MLLPVALVRPDVNSDSSGAHWFAQGMGRMVAAVDLLVLPGGSPIDSWALAGAVMVLVGSNWSTGWRAGCTLYYWLSRLGAPGFDKQQVWVG